MFKRLFIIACALWLAAGFVFGQRPERVRCSDKTEIVEMADAFWIASGGISNFASWNDTGNWSIAAVPGSSHEIVFDGLRSQASVSGGTASTAAVASIRTMPNYPGDIGVVGSPLVIDPDQFIIQGSGRVIFSKVGATTTLIAVDSPNLVDAFRLAGVAVSGVTDISVLGGRCHIGPVLQAPRRIDVTPSGVYPVIVDIQLNIGANFGTLLQSGGTVTLESSCDTATLVGGDLFLGGLATPTTFYITGGRAIFDANLQVSPLNIYILGGVADFSDVATTQTITAVVVFPGGELVNPGNVGFTSLTEFTGATPLFP